MIRWLTLHFDELTNKQLYELLRLRSEVFVVEQNCVFLDMDNLDQLAHHVLGYEEGQLIGCTRILAPGVSYEQASIGRVVTSPAARGRGLGRELMLQSIQALYHLHGQQPIKIGAQAYLAAFYGSLGFVQSGPEYLEDGIPHIPMIKNL